MSDFRLQISDVRQWKEGVELYLAALFFTLFFEFQNILDFTVGRFAKSLQNIHFDILHIVFANTAGLSDSPVPHLLPISISDNAWLSAKHQA